MNSLNRVELIGHLGHAPVLKVLNPTTQVVTLHLATSEAYLDSQKQWQKKTEWHTLILWNKQAETAVKILSKGALVYVEGKLQSRNYTGNDGEKRTVTEIQVERFIALDTKGKDTGRSGTS